MANPDTPNGFRFVKSMSGAPSVGMIRSAEPSGADIYKFDVISIEGSSGSKLAEASTTNDDTFVGVAVGFGKKTDMTGEYPVSFNPSNLEKIWYDDSENTSADWRVFYIPVEGNVFEVQSDTDLDLGVGDVCDLLATTSGSSTTGISGHQIGASTNADLIIVDIPRYPDNDPTLANTRYHVMFSSSTILSN